MKRTDACLGLEEEQPQEILDQVVKDASLFSAMRTPGPLQPAHLFPPFSGELILLTLPDVMNPLDLIHSEVVVGGRKDSVVVAGGHKYRMATYMSDPDHTNLPCLFLPDEDGQLSKVTGEIKACMVVKGEVEEREEDNQNCVDIETLRSVHYKTPKELQRRDFFTKTKTREVTMKTGKPTERKKKNVGNNSLDDSLHSNGDIQSPLKKKKVKHLPQISKRASGNSQSAEAMEYPMRKIKKEPDSENINSSPYKEKRKSK